jgi:hypothetical protein
MIELKVHCDCGQRYKFDVEPVNNQMPFKGVFMLILLSRVGLISLIAGAGIAYRISANA